MKRELKKWAHNKGQKRLEGVPLARTGTAGAPEQIRWAATAYNPRSKKQTIRWLLNALWGLMENRICTWSKTTPSNYFLITKGKVVTLQQRRHWSKLTSSGRGNRLSVPPHEIPRGEHITQVVLQPKGRGLNLILWKHRADPKRVAFYKRPGPHVSTMAISWPTKTGWGTCRFR